MFILFGAFVEPVNEPNSGFIGRHKAGLKSVIESATLYSTAQLEFGVDEESVRSKTVSIQPLVQKIP